MERMVQPEDRLEKLFAKNMNAQMATSPNAELARQRSLIKESKVVAMLLED
jgi:hypothetical protein